MKLYICQSLDGYIAKSDGSIDFLEQFNDLIANSPNERIANTYQDFMSNISNIVEGYTTYKQIDEMGYGAQYSQYNHYVITNHHQHQIDDNVTAFIDFDQLERLNLEADTTFLVGGSKIITEALNRNLVTEIIITGLPIMLGSGIKLFEGIKSNPKLAISDITNDQNFYQVTYQVKY